MGDFAAALLFIVTLLAEAILVLCVLTYAMHCLLVVVRDTAAGNDEAAWPEEPFQDWVGGALQLVAVVLIWLAPIGVLTRALGKVWLPDDAGLRFLILAVPGLWLFFPVALLSSLSASSRWFVFRPVVVWNLLRLAPSTLAVYGLSALLGAAVAALGYAVFVRGWFLLAPIAAVGTAAAFLIYARLLGRLGWKMSQLSAGKRKASKKGRSKGRTVAAQDPWAMPDAPVAPEEADPEFETTPYGQKRRRVKGYGLAAPPPAQPAEVAPPSPRTPREGYTPLDAGPPPDPDRHIPVPSIQVAAPRRSFLAGVFAFPAYSKSRKAWLLLSLGFLAVGGLAYVLASRYAALYGAG